SGEASSVPGWGDTATELACASARSAVGVRPFVAALEDPLSPQAHSPAHIASAAISTLARIVVKPSARIIESPCESSSNHWSEWPGSTLHKAIGAQRLEL